MTQREVTERDFRAPEFRDAKVEDYEFRGDGKVVRKDRWETGIRRIAGLLGMSREEWEVPEIVERVDALIGPSWEEVADLAGELEVAEAEWPEHEEEVQVKTVDGSLIHRARWDGVLNKWMHRRFLLARAGSGVVGGQDNVVIAWRRVPS